MEHVDKLIPLLALVGIGVFLLFLLRLAKSEPAAVAVQTTPVKSLPIATPVSVPVAVPVLAETPRDVNDVPANAIVEPATSPIHDLLHSLKKKDALTTAFLLNEILGPPVSKRKRA